MPIIKAGNINLSYATYGEGEPLLLIMGFGMPGAAWLPSLPFFAGFKSIYFDNRGTGLSDKPEGPYTVEDMADDASNLLEALDIPSAKVFGVSMGGMIAQELMLRHPEQVIKTVLGCTMPGGPNTRMAGPDVIEMLMTGSKLMTTDPEKGFDIMLPALMPPEFNAAQPEIKPMLVAGAKMMPPTPPETADRAMAGIASFNAYDRLEQIKCPVMIVHGDQDVLVPPENAELIKGKIAHAEMYLIPGAGHAFQSVDPVGIHQRIVTWLKN
ncbi:MAG: alpha/beta fold hydrolase [Candidatus Binatus sp.]|uniref:alpha/beta fold hydrolase n=1 Tax=Candidatus Binatus sp. TaxID=2811406 RepID=UPI0027171BA4|nr:alpha/beta fold hydrolase [Candidatus Binatus sp.]MDO8432889.1 alpha/beta fold hydrolase [Candidatus Binatus sp.]